MVKLMLRPGWPGKVFRRTVRNGKKSRRLTFKAGAVVEVSDPDFAALKTDVGNAIFEVEIDDKNRPRFVESVGEKSVD